MSRRARLLRAFTALGLLGGATGTELRGQGVRGWVETTLHAVDLRAFAVDTLPFSDAVPGPGGNYSFAGERVACVVDRFCTRYRAGARGLTVVGTQDVSLTAWGFGAEGLSATTYLRARGRSGDGVAWPRSDDRFDALLAYAQWVRGGTRIRLGRQEVRTGLGFPGFDGVGAVLGGRSLGLELYGGRSLARGLREPANEALRGLENYLPDRSAWLLGAGLRLDVGRTGLTGRYHREIHADRSGLVSERASLDVVSTVPGGRLSASIDYDLGFAQFGKGLLAFLLPVRGGRGSVEASLRRYLPYFEISTIWGFFQPVPYHEADIRLGWSPTADLVLWGGGGYRRYGDAEATVVFRPLQSRAWRAHAAARWAPSTSWTLSGEYRVERGAGAFLSAADVRASFAALEALRVAVTVTTFQQIEEFRVGDGRALGSGLSFEWQASGRVAFSGGGSVLRHRDGGSAFTSPWDQSRFWTSARVSLGSDPGNRQGGAP